MFVQSISEIMRESACCQIDSNATLSCALKLMRDSRVNALLVHDGGNFCGVVTKRDIIRPVSDGKAYMSDTRVHDVMDQDPSIVRVGARIIQAVVQMMQTGLRQVVVVDSALDAVGVLDWRDIPRDFREIADREVGSQLAMAAE